MDDGLQIAALGHTAIGVEKAAAEVGTGDEREAQAIDRADGCGASAADR